MRLMVWNINRFNRATLTRSNYNVSYIRSTVTGQPLDIFIVIEVQTAQHGVRGQLITGEGCTGVLTLLQLLRNLPGHPDWRLVPPVRLSPVFAGNEYNEGIAVFYNAATLTFTGPDYIGAQGIVTPNAHQATAYPNTWNGALPVGNNRAGRLNFQHYQNHSMLNFPDDRDRRPWLTTFTEIGGAGRTLKLFALHFPPTRHGEQGNPRACQATMSLSNAAELRNLAPKEVAIVAGDFNINLRQFGNLPYSQQTQYQFLIAALGGGLPRIPLSETMIESVNTATVLRGHAPGYGYLRNLSLDNIFLRYAAPAAPPANHNALVVNRVIGTGANYPVDMFNTIPQILGFPAADFTQQERNDLFRFEENYGHLGTFNNLGTSDHLPLVIDI
jgi:hypothetical protein